MNTYGSLSAEGDYERKSTIKLQEVGGNVAMEKWGGHVVGTETLKDSADRCKPRSVLRGVHTFGSLSAEINYERKSTIKL